MNACGAAAVALSLVFLAACSDGDSVQGSNGQVLKPGKISVFDLAVGNCAVPPDKADVELTQISVMPCTDPHTMEVFALPKYAKGDDFPGDEKLKAAADVACANEFEHYVGVPYTDSKLFFTYLTPSARSWSGSHDRRTACFITTTGAPLSRTVKGSKR